MNDNHVIEALGKTKVVIEDGIITEIGDPQIEHCPIFSKYHNIEKITRDDIKKNIEYRIDDFGMCSKNRKVKEKDLLSVGISEILRSNQEIGYIDCVVGACDGVGTLIITDPEIIQGVGGRVSGLISTTPIDEVINKVGRKNVIHPETARLDPIGGIKEAISRGYKNIAVTIIPSETIGEIRKLDLPSDIQIFILVAHTTGISQKEAEEIFKHADIVTACASKNVRKQAETERTYYYGDAISIYATSKYGKELLDNRLKCIDKPLSTNKYPQDSSNHPYPQK